jgi:nucleoside 2-deoxyribosyltransferase
MRIAICSSAEFAKESQKIKEKLEKKGLEVLLYPQTVTINQNTIDVCEYYKMRKKELTPEVLDAKRQLMNEHIDKIKISDAVLILNFDKPQMKGYVGGNTFLEMGIAYCLGKKVFIWKTPSESLPYFEEIAAMKPVNIEENLEKIR